MEGVVDAIMRDLLCAIGGIDVCVTEFIRINDHLLPDKVFYKRRPPWCQRH
jgi:tRNA-dihydrouridine synthase C